MSLTDAYLKQGRISANDNAGCERSRAQVPAEIEALRMEIKVTCELVQALRERLGSVIDDRPRPSNGEKIAEDGRSLVPLASVIKDGTCELAQVNGMLRGMVDTIQL